VRSDQAEKEAEELDIIDNHGIEEVKVEDEHE